MNFKKNRINDLFGLEIPLIQAGMVWVSGGKLAAASANAGILGVIGAGSMKLELLKAHIEKAQRLTDPKARHRLAVNIPLLYPDAKAQMEMALSLGIKVFITSAGSPKLFTSFLKEAGAIVVHVTSNPELAVKCEEAGCHAVVAEGFEAGGHNGRDELTSLVLVPQVAAAIKIPLIAAGGFYDGRGVIAAMALGAEGVQMGTRFVATVESSAHPHFKQAIIDAKATSTMLSLKKLVPVRLLKNHFYEELKKLEEAHAGPEEFKKILGKGRAKKGMLEGDLEEGELEIGQIAGAICDIPTVSHLVLKIKKEIETVQKNLSTF